MKNIIILTLPFFLLSCVTLSREDWTQKQYYEDARELVESGSYNIAIDVLNEMQTKFPYGIYTGYAWLEKASAYLESGDSALAQIEINEFLRNYPHHQHVDYAFFMLAVSEEAKIRGFIHLYINDPARTQSDPINKALGYYQQLIKKFPNSQYVAHARKAVISLTNLLARREIFIAQSYQKLSAWVAMISRAEYVLKNYPRTVYTDEALLLMEDGYAKLGLLRIATEIRKYYQHNKGKFRDNEKELL